jgi:hypothetical protein
VTITGCVGRFSRKAENIKFHGSTFSGSRADTYGQTEMPKLIGAFRGYAKAPESL